MDCKNIEELFSAYADKELDLQTASLLENHLHSCEACGREWNSLRKTMDYLRYIEEVNPPPDLLRGIYEKLEQPSLFMRFTQWFRHANPTMSIPAAALTVVLAFVAMTLFKNYSLNTPLSPLTEKTEQLKVAENNIDIKPYLNPPRTSYHLTQKPDFQGFRFDAPQSRLQSYQSAGRSSDFNFVTAAKQKAHDPSRPFLFPERQPFFENLIPGNNFGHHLTPDLMITVKTADPSTKNSLEQKLLSEKKWHPRMYKNNLYLLFLKPDELKNLQNTLALQEIGNSSLDQFAETFEMPKMLMVAVRLE